MGYVGAARAPVGCVFCAARSGSDDRSSLVLCRRDLAFLILNAYPYTPGHLMAVVNRHVGTLTDATADEIGASMELVKLAVAVLTVEYRAEGFNIGLNQGRVAGAGLPGHLHWHIVPRWNGDTNFMPVLGETKVLAQSLDALYDLIRVHL